MRKLIVLIESILAALQSSFNLSKAIADQIGLTGDGEILLNNALASFNTLGADLKNLKADVNDEPPVEPPAA